MLVLVLFLELAPEDFASAGFGQLIDKTYAARDFVVRQFAAAPINEGGGIDGVGIIFFQGDDGFDGLAAVCIRDANDTNLMYGWVVVTHIFNFEIGRAACRESEREQVVEG